MKRFSPILLLLMAGCDSPTTDSPPLGSTPSSLSSQSFSTEATTLSTPTQAGSAPTLNGDVELTLAVAELADKRVRLSGATNLPSGTKLMLSVKEDTDNGFFGQSHCFVSPTGSFESEAFGPKGGLKDGRYIAEVTMPVADVQPANVRAVIGDKGENLAGPLVDKNSYGVTASQQQEFAIGANADAAQAERKQQTDAAIASLKQQLCIYLEQLLAFKDDPKFKEYGFGIGGPYNKWLREVEALRDAQPKGSHPIPLLLRAAPGDLIMLGMDYIQKEESDYTRQMLPEIKEAIDYDGYLAAKSKPAGSGPEMRTWRDSSGKFSVEATLEAINGDQVVLRKRDGRTISVPIGNLSDQDVGFIEGHANSIRE